MIAVEGSVVLISGVCLSFDDISSKKKENKELILQLHF